MYVKRHIHLPVDRASVATSTHLCPSAGDATGPSSVCAALSHGALTDSARLSSRTSREVRQLIIQSDTQWPACGGSSRRVGRSDSLGFRSRRFQYRLIWLVNGIGAEYLTHSVGKIRDRRVKCSSVCDVT